MRADPFQRFLGADRHATPAQLLGLENPRPDRVEIETALRKRLAQVYRHPASSSRDAERVRKRLREAADELTRRTAPSSPLERAPSRPLEGADAPESGPPATGLPQDGPSIRPSSRAIPSPAARRLDRPSAQRHSFRRQPADAIHQLTAFDRTVMAALVASGGWNARSRAQLVALAEAHNVTPGGLLKVMRGLNDYARTGGPRLAVSDITSGAPRMPGPTPRPGAPAATTMTLAEAQRLLEESGDDGPAVWWTVRLSALFGLITVLLCVLLMRVVMDDAPAGQQGQMARAPLSGEAPDASGAGADPDERASEVTSASRVLRFDRYPTFMGNALPPVSADAADESPQLPAFLDEVSRKLAVTEMPSDAVFRDWEVSINTIATGWVLVDQSTRSAVRRGVFDVLYESADTPSAVDRLLAALIPPTHRIDDPVDLWRGAWKAGMLGEIVGRGTLPPVIVQRAGELLADATGGVAPAQLRTGFDSAAAVWLAQAAEDLIDILPFDDQFEDRWELWLAAERELENVEQFQDAMMSAVTGILHSDVNLAQPGPSTQVLGRLLKIADFSASHIVKQRMRELFEDEAGVTSDDLWVLTSLLAENDNAAWFGSELVLPLGADDLFRHRTRDRIAAAWPALPDPASKATVHGRALTVDADVAGRWWSVASRLLESREPPPARDDVQLMDLLLAAAQLNHAAVLLAAQSSEEAQLVLEEIERILAPPPAPQNGGAMRPQPQKRAAGARLDPGRGQTVGPDGEWAAAYEEVRRNTSEKLKWLRTLRSAAGSDLGPVDAESFVREVYRGSPVEVRNLARTILIEQFERGPNVAMELINQLPDAPRHESVSETVRRLTGTVLPSPDTSTWPIEVRRALVDHALALRLDGASPVDERAQKLAQAYQGRLQVLQRSATGGFTAPQEVVLILAESWRDRAESTMGAVPVPADLMGLERRWLTRRRLAEGPIQMMVADQLAILEHLAYITVAEQPPLETEVRRLLAESMDRRRRAGHVLQQAIEAELTIARLWSLRMELTEESAEPPEAEPATAARPVQ